MMKSRFFSFANIFGLSAGLACCMLISLYLRHETSYDSSDQKNIDRLYQVGTSTIKKGEKDSKSANTPAPLASALKQEFPEIIESARLVGLFTEDKTLIQYNPASGDRKFFLEDKGYLAESSFFKLFNYNFREGSAAGVLDKPNSVVISEDIAKKIFGDRPAINQVLHINSKTNGEYNYTVTGVFRPSNTPSHIDARFFLSVKGGDMEKYFNEHAADFASNDIVFTYILLRPDADAARLEAKMPSFIHKYADVSLKQLGFYKKQFLIPVKDIHLSDELTSNVTPPASRIYLYVLASIAVFTLLIACVNFMNLSTARSSKRSSEVGIRKVLGAKTNALIIQFLGESFLMTSLALILALIITILLLPIFGEISGKHINLSLANDWGLFVGFLVLALATGLIAGSYPAFYLSSFNPIKVLKGKLSNTLAVVAVRKGLVIFQFVISIVLIIATVVIAKQMHFLHTANLGFDKDQQLVISLRSDAAKSIYPLLKNELKNNSQVLSVGASYNYPGIFNPSAGAFYKRGQSMKDAKNTSLGWVDPGFLQTLNVKPVAGHIFSDELRTDTGNRVVINESAVREIGFSSPQKAVGDKIYFDWKGKTIGFEIVGVVKDFHFQDLHLPVTPCVYQMLLEKKNSFKYIIVHARAGKATTVLQTARNIWRKYDINDPFEYSFLDDDFQKNYAADNRLAALVEYFTAIAIIISCLGLFGLVAFSAEQRVKEIGVRKVLGAKTTAIVSLLSVDFLKLILVAIVIASPIAWFIMNKWLMNFAYRETIGLAVFVYTTLITLVIGIGTIGYQAIKAALANPVKSLRSE